MNTKMIIRPEEKEEYSIICELVKIAFKTAKVSNGDEQNYVVRLREGANYIPELALVAEIDGRLVGHIMLTKTEIKYSSNNKEALLLAPLSVVLEYRNRGIGGELIKEAFKRARLMGYRAAFLVGDPAYYERFGFRSTADFKIRCDMDIPAEYVMAYELENGYLEPNGIVRVV